MPLHVYYDTRLAPVTFDFATFLANAHAHSQLIGTTSIYLYIVAPKFRQMSYRDLEYEDSEKRWRMHHILGQLPRVMPSIMRTIIQHDSFNQISYPNFPANYPPLPGKDLEFPYVAGYAVKNHKSGLDVRPFSASSHAKQLVRTVTQERDYVTISLRTSAFQTERNSNLDAWYEVYCHLQKRGKKVLVLPDFEDMMTARQALEYDWDVVEFAAYDLDLRLALYEGADDNFAVNNGVCSIMFFSSVPFKLFKLETPGIVSTEAKTIGYTWSVKAGETPELFQSNQKWIWEDDTYENIAKYLGG